ncbi:UNVERIFIED_CONTAM: hypothetical protein Slati_1329400 [Sesamum latifolium]|uniref:Uncharacterized protein n=1 Tax=Sesamum latifolium TaxID=2727402 RepID=A0AAW2XI83_9LAMI
MGLPTSLRITSFASWAFGESSLYRPSQKFSTDHSRDGAILTILTPLPAGVCLSSGIRLLLIFSLRTYHHKSFTVGDSNPVWCKLDRVLLNNEWLEAGLQCSAHFNPSGCLSDHSPDHPEFIATVGEGWRLNVEGTTQFKLCKKLKALKNSLKAFNRLHYSHISVRAKEADLALQNAQLHLESNPGDTTIRDSWGAFRKKAVFFAEAERHFYYQKAKMHFLNMGDRNTKFFHDMVKRNAAKSSILAITKSDGSTITSEADIGQEFVAYFTSLLGTEAQTLPVDSDVFEWGPKLSSEHALELCREVTPSEVKSAIFQVCDNKAPGPDGFSACFFKRA